MAVDIPMIPCNVGNYKHGRSQSIKYIVVHYTSNNGDTAVNNGNYFKNNVVKSSAHYFADENRCIQSVDGGNTAWHCGAKSYVHPYCRNDNSIGVEMCSRIDSDGKYYIKQETADNALKIVKYLMEKYNIPIDNVLRHYDVTGKWCPKPWVDDSSKWIEFKAKLVKEDEEEMTQEKFNEMFAVMQDGLKEAPAQFWSKDARDWAVGNGIFAGTDAGDFMWQDFLTREQLAIVLYRFSQLK